MRFVLPDDRVDRCDASAVEKNSTTLALDVTLMLNEINRNYGAEF